MESIRFEKFTLLINSIYKSVNKIKIDFAPSFGVKSVHILWVYKLLQSPDGLTATELAAKSMVNRSLVSREIEKLKKAGYIASLTNGDKRYKEKYVLTDEGRTIAEKICGEVLNVQNKVNAGINEGELKVFYSTLEKLNENFNKITKKKAEKKHEKQI